MNFDLHLWKFGAFLEDFLSPFFSSDIPKRTMVAFNDIILKFWVQLKQNSYCYIGGCSDGKRTWWMEYFNISP